MADTIDRRLGVAGELVLRRSGDHFEIIANGVFLMDTRNGESERLLVTSAAAAMPPGPLLIGGLGVGFSLRAALDHPRVADITVVEREAAVIDWCSGPLRHVHDDALSDPRVRCVHADLRAWLPDKAGFAAICLDIDNGPEWTVSPDNAALYAPAGLDLLAGALAPGGVLAVWSASASEAFAARLRARFDHVEQLPVPVPRGEPDVVYLAL
ncbi:MAG TPA: spermidine synthase [Actinophytocola sp.]|uniref:spermine/spermidine synthase domain-containing protein n=1 Tax=Actinophytocola sp. TaxID=1872138 RepID=UPI002DDD41CC|nr:spermidine synthase [Actinophytocola sp.]HEV2784609.1 spermidine synthase [Actinophytocola sp.]